MIDVCLYCGEKENLVTDHLVPRSRGGKEIPENLFKSCIPCNSSKKDRLPSEWRRDLPQHVYEIEKRSLRLHPGTKSIVEIRQKQLEKRVAHAVKMHKRASANLDRARAQASIWRKRVRHYERESRDPRVAAALRKAREKLDPVIDKK